MNTAPLLTTILLISHQGMASVFPDVACGGVDDTDQIQSAIDMYPEIDISGTCVTTGPIVIGSDKLITGIAKIYATANPAIIITGQAVTLRDLIITGSGNGISLDYAYKIRLEDIQINTLAGSGILANNGAGLWVSNVHFNGTQGGGTYGINFGNWDSAWLRDTLVEEHDTGVRFGTSDGTTANIFVNGVVVDRSVIAFNIEPDGGASVQNILVSNSWGAGSANGLVPVSVSGGSTSGYVGSVIFSSSYFSDFRYKDIWTYKMDGTFINDNSIIK